MTTLPLTYVAAGGIPVTERTGGLPVTTAASGGLPATVVSVNGLPISIVGGAPEPEPEPIVATHVGADEDVADNALTVGPFTPPAGALLVAFHGGQTTSTDVTGSSVVSGGTTWTRRRSLYQATAYVGDPWIAVHTSVADGSPVTVSAAANGSHRHVLTVAQVTGWDALGTTGSGGAQVNAGLSCAISFSAPPDAGSTVLAGIALRDWGLYTTIAPVGSSLYAREGANGTDIDENDFAVQSITGLDGSPETLWTFTDSGDFPNRGWASVAIEITP